MNEQDATPLVDFYNSLESTGTLMWDTSSSLCYEEEIGCIAGRAVDMYTPPLYYLNVLLVTLII